MVVINTGRRVPARSVAHALELVDQVVREGESWRVVVRIGAGDEHVVRSGVGAVAA